MLRDYQPCLYRNTTDGPAYDFILTRGELRPFDGQLPGPTWRVLAASREWHLHAKVAGAVVATPEGYADPGPCPLPAPTS